MVKSDKIIKAMLKLCDGFFIDKRLNSTYSTAQDILAKDNLDGYSEYEVESFKEERDFSNSLNLKLQELSSLIGAESKLSPFQELKASLTNIKSDEDANIDALGQSILLIIAQLSLYELILDKAIKSSMISDRRSK